MNQLLLIYSWIIHLIGTNCRLYYLYLFYSLYFLLSFLLAEYWGWFVGGWLDCFWILLSVLTGSFVMVHFIGDVFTDLWEIVTFHEDFGHIRILLYYIRFIMNNNSCKDEYHMKSWCDSIENVDEIDGVTARRSLLFWITDLSFRNCLSKYFL